MRLALVVLLTGVAPAAADPKVPQEVTDLLKIVGGTWRCTGSAVLSAEADGPMTCTVTTKADLDGFWIRSTVEAKVGKARSKSESFTTFDSKKWRRVQLDNRGAQTLGTSDGMKDGKMDWNLDVMGPAPSLFRDHLDATDPKLLKLWGEVSSDKGKTWTKVYEMSCKK